MALTTSQIAAAAERSRSFTNLISSAAVDTCYKIAQIESTGYYQLFICDIALEILNSKLFSVKGTASGTISIAIKDNNVYVKGLSGTVDLTVVSTVSGIEVFGVAETPSGVTLTNFAFGGGYKEFLTQSTVVDSADIVDLKTSNLQVATLTLNTLKVGGWTISVNNDSNTILIS